MRMQMDKAVVGDVIQFTTQSMEFIYKLFGESNENIIKQNNDIRDKALGLLCRNNNYTDNIEKLDAVTAVGEVFKKAAPEIACEMLNIPLAIIPTQYLVCESNVDHIKIKVLNDNPIFLKDNQEKWRAFKDKISTIKINEQHPYFIMGSPIYI